MATATAAHSADTEFLVRRGATKGYQYASLLSPVIYTMFSLRYRAWSFNRLLRATWVGGSAGKSCLAQGVAVGGAFEYVRSASANEANVRARRIKYAYDTDSIRADDHSTIGAILIGVLAPALFWKRARAVHLILGGAGLGSSIGLITHYARSLTGDTPPVVAAPPPVAPPVQP